jgi:speckle-type POZ protein
MLADLYYRSGKSFALPGVGNFNDYTVIEVTDVEPHIFRHLLRYVYGGSVPEEELKTHAKDIIEAADKYAIVNLKLEAEAAYVESTTITTDNAIDNLLYADAKSCALIEEAVFDFLMQNGEGVITMLSFDDVPGHLAKDILTFFMRKEEIKKKAVDEFDIMRVGELRRKLDEKGLAVGGKRKKMIEALKENS